MNILPWACPSCHGHHPHFHHWPFLLALWYRCCCWAFGPKSPCSDLLDLRYYYCDYEAPCSNCYVFFKSRGNVDNCVSDDDNYLKADLPSAKERLLDLKNGSFRNYQNIFPKYIFLGFASCVLWEVTPSPSPLFRTQKVTFRQKCWLFNAKNRLPPPPPHKTFFYPIPYHQDARGGQNWVFGWSFRRPPFFSFLKKQNNSPCAHLGDVRPRVLGKKSRAQWTWDVQPLAVRVYFGFVDSDFLSFCLSFNKWQFVLYGSRCTLMPSLKKFWVHFRTLSCKKMCQCRGKRIWTNSY